jgi:DNA-binding MarR family transcriptional regulator
MYGKKRIRMSAMDTAKEIARIASTASLGKDVIELLEKKVSLLAEQVTTLETENANLKQKVANLDQQFAAALLTGKLHPEAIRFLKLLFEHDKGLTVSQIASSLGISKGMAEYHHDVLLNAEMVGSSVRMPKGSALIIFLEAKGRAYLVEHRHV